MNPPVKQVEIPVRAKVRGLRVITLPAMVCLAYVEIAEYIEFIY